MRSIYFFLTFLLAFNNVQAQSSNAGIHLFPQFGFRLHDDTQEDISSGAGRVILSSPTFGLCLPIPGSNIGVVWQSNFHIVPEIPVQTAQININWAYHETWIEHQLQVYYRFRSFYTGIGPYWKRRENYLNHTAPGAFAWKHSGLSLSAGTQINWLNLEFQTQVHLKPGFAALGSSQHSLLLLYNFDKTRRQQKSYRKITVNALLGARFFSTQRIELLDGEDMTPVGISPALGLEFLHRKTGLSLNMERDWFLSINGSSPYRNIKSYINTAFWGIGYHHLLKNQRYLRFRLGGSFIIDYTLAANHTWNTPNVNRLSNYQVKGIGAVLSYEILPSTDVEIKHTFPVLGDEMFNPTRLSVGLIYRYNPTI